MKYLLAGLFILALAAPLHAQEMQTKQGPLFLIRQPINMNYGPYPLLAVVFNHSSHKAVKCRECHHKADENGKRFIACTSSGCHSSPDARARNPKSMFMAYHAPNRKRSCFGCHKREAANYASFKGCQPCHGSAQQMASK